VSTRTVQQCYDESEAEVRALESKIATLQAEVQRLRGALYSIAWVKLRHQAQGIARKALEATT